MKRTFRHQRSSCIRRFTLLFAGFVGLSKAHADAKAIPRIERPAHQIVENTPVQHTLNDVPLPFLDWGLVQAGTIRYVRRDSKEVLPLNDPHPLTDPNDVEAIPIAVPTGIQLVTQPATKGGTFAQEIFTPSYPWEENCTVHTLLYEPAAQLYRLWYRTKQFYAYAESADFKSWHRPLKSVVAHEGHSQTNILGVTNGAELQASAIRSPQEAQPGRSGSFFIDPAAAPGERFKCVFLAHLKDDTAAYARQSGLPLSAMTGPGSTVLWGAVSADGIAWKVHPTPIMLHDADTLTVVNYNVHRQRYVMYTRLYELNRRTIAYSETDDFRRWPLPRNCSTPGANLGPSTDYYASAFAFYPGRTELSTMLILAYDRAIDRSEIRLASSRDGHNFHSLPGDPVISTNPGVPGESGFLAAFPSSIRTPDDRMLAFYDVHHAPHKFPRHRFGGSRHFAAVWPADRMAAIESPQRGEFTTPPLKLRGNPIILNMLSERTGGISVEILDEDFRPIPGRTFADSDRMIGDHRAVAATWKGDGDVSEYSGRDVYLAFQLRSAKLFAISAGSLQPAK